MYALRSSLIPPFVLTLIFGCAVSLLGQSPSVVGAPPLAPREADNSIKASDLPSANLLADFDERDALPIKTKNELSEGPTQYRVDGANMFVNKVGEPAQNDRFNWSASTGQSL